jgi:excisionase family DNA binding protein
MEIVNTAQAAQVLGITRRRVNALIKEGRLPATKLGRDWAIGQDDLEAFAKLPRPTGKRVGSFCTKRKETNP